MAGDSAQHVGATGALAASPPAPLEFRVLGPLDVVGPRGSIPLSGSLRRALVALLLLSPNEVVSTETLADGVWSDERPRTATKSLQMLVAHVRSALEGESPPGRRDAVLVSAPSGYKLAVAPDGFDVWRFERLIDTGRSESAAGTVIDAIEHLEAALALWRGRPFADIEGRPEAMAEIARLETLHHVAAEARFDCYLTLGRHAEVVGELEAQVAANPLRERPWGQLMLALYRCGRQADALRAFGRLRGHLGEELGIEPSRELVSLEQDILLQRRELDEFRRVDAGGYSSTATSANRRSAPGDRSDQAAGSGTAGVGLGRDRLAAPTGTVTFLFTDIEGSTRLWEVEPAVMTAAVAQHDELVRREITARRGHIFSTAGDSFAAAFWSAAEAAAAAVAVQRAIAQVSWPGGGAPRVRIGIHTGTADERDGDYFGPCVNRAQRLMAAAHGGQVVVSSAARDLLETGTTVTGGWRKTGLVLIDLGEHQLKDLSTPEHIWQLTIEDLLLTFPPLRTLDRGHTNLPVQLSSFVGRQDEIRRVEDLLSRYRLVTLTGAGGVGKTRLAVHAAADCASQFPDGVGFVELASSREPASVPYQFLHGLDVKSEPDRPPLDVAAAAVGARRVLVVVDNCEHLRLPIADAIRVLVDRCPNLTVLATSREALGIDGEAVFTVAPLPVEGALSPATQLFIDRAVTVGAARVTLESRQHVVSSLCAHLDGLPLAIELAAARARSMTPEDIEAHLHQRFRLLAGTADIDVRHRTLLRTIQWSYDLLDRHEQQLFHRLGVFAGSFNLEAVAAVCSDGDLDEFDVIDVIGQLVNKSLILADVSGPTAQFQLLETLREYALGQLGHETAHYRLRHARYFASWMNKVADRLLTQDEPAAIAELNSGWPDLRAAVLFALDTPDGDLVADLVGRLVAEQLFRNRTEVRDWVIAALERRGAASNHTVIRILATCATADALPGNSAAVQNHLSTLLRLDLAGRLTAWHPEDVLLVAVAILAGAPSLAEDAVRLFAQAPRERHDPLMTALLSAAEAMAATMNGRPDEGAARAAACQDLIPIDSAPSYLALFEWLRIIAWSSTSPATHVEQLERGLNLCRSVGNDWLANTYANFLASVRAERGDLPGAMELLADSLERNSLTRNMTYISASFRRAAILLGKTGAHRETMTLLAAIEDHPQSTSSAHVHAELREVRRLINDALSPGDIEAASTLGRSMPTERAIGFAVAALRARAASATSHHDCAGWRAASAGQQ